MIPEREVKVVQGAPGTRAPSGTAIVLMIAMGASLQIYAASIGIQDSIFLMLLALVVFGPRRLPEIGRQIGKLMYEFRKVSNDFKFQMEEELRTHEEAERQRKLQASLPPPAPAVTTPEPAAMQEGSGEPQTVVALVEEPMPAAPIETTPEPAADSAARLQVKPPSTGEQVAAARPFRSSAPPAHEPTGESEPGVSAETETHHG